MTPSGSEEAKIIKKFETATRKFWRGNYEEARAALENILESSTDHLVLTDRINSYISACRQRLGEDDFNPRSAEDHFLLGLVRVNNGELKEGISSLNKALGKQKKNDAWLFSLACSYALDNQADEAANALEKAIALNGDNRIHARNCPDFRRLRGHEKIRRLIGPAFVRAR